MGSAYPARDKFFALRFIRLLTKSAAAMEIGADGCWLLAIVVGQEDACRYRRPVNFFNSQLCSLLGIPVGNERQLRRIRERCEAAGWLQYEGGGKRKPGRYFVVIPEHALQLPDGTSDEMPTEGVQGSVQDSSAICPQSVRETSVNCPPSLPLPSPRPNPSPERERPADESEDNDPTLPAAPAEETPETIVTTLAVHVHVRFKDPERTAEAKAMLVFLAKTYGLKRCCSVAEAARLKNRGKIYPEELEAALAEPVAQPASGPQQWSLDDMAKAYPQVSAARSLIASRGWQWARDLWGYTAEQMPDEASALEILRTDVPASEVLIRKAQAQASA